MKSAWDWKLLRRTANQAGIVVFGAGLVHGFIGKGAILSSATLAATAVFLIVLSIMRRHKMDDVVWVALAGAFPLVVLMIYGLYINR